MPALAARAHRGIQPPGGIHLNYHHRGVFLGCQLKAFSDVVGNGGIDGTVYAEKQRIAFLFSYGKDGGRE